MTRILDFHNSMYIFNSIIFMIGLWKAVVLMNKKRLGEKQIIIAMIGNFVAVLFFIQVISLLLVGDWVFKDLWHVINFLIAVNLIFIYTKWEK